MGETAIDGGGRAEKEKKKVPMKSNLVTSVMAFISQCARDERSCRRSVWKQGRGGSNKVCHRARRNGEERGERQGGGF